MSKGTSFRRVVIALGTSRESVARLATWAALARRFDAELAGLFIEDVALLHLAGLPFAQVIGVDCVARAVDRATVERFLRRAASDARAALESTAAAHAVSCSFATVRGDVAREIAANVGRNDLVVLEAEGYRADACGALARCDASVLHVRPETARGRTVIVLVSDATDPLLPAAAHLATVTGRTLAVVLDEDGGEDLRRAVGLALDAVVPADSRTRADLLSGGASRIIELVGRDPGAILVSQTIAPLTSGSAARQPFDPPPCALLLVPATANESA